MTTLYSDGVVESLYLAHGIYSLISLEVNIGANTNTLFCPQNNV